MNKSMHFAVFFYIVAQQLMSWFKELSVDIRSHERTLGHSQVITKTDNINNIAHRFTNLFKSCQMSFHQLIKKLFYILLITQKIHKKVIHSSQKSSPFK